MFGFGKKKEPKQKEAPVQHKGYQQLAAQFEPEELTILAVTGVRGFSGRQTEEEGLWAGEIALTAWMEEDSPEIRREECQLTAVGDERLLGYLRQRIPPNFIVKCRARASGDGRRLLLLDLPEPGFDPDLKAILEEQKKPVTFTQEGLGTFELSRAMGWFRTETDWAGTPVQLVFDQDEDRSVCLDIAKQLLADAVGWDARIRVYAAGELAGLASDWMEDGEEMTPAQLAARLEPETIEVREPDVFTFWFGDPDQLDSRSIRVEGSLSDGPTDASMED